MQSGDNREMTEFKKFSEATEKANVYKVGWTKDGEELVSSEVELTGPEDGINAALMFAADDLREANPDLFAEEITEELIIEEVSEDVVG